MKKSYLMIAVAASLFTACAEKGTFKEVAGENAEIGFASEAVYKATRAVEGLDLNWFQTVGNSFGVYGFKNAYQSASPYTIDASSDIYTNEEVTCTVSNTSLVTWAHSTIRFWDKAATGAYNFFAYAPYDNSNPTYTKGSASGAGTDAASKQNFSPTFTYTNLPLIAEIKADNLNADKMVASAIKNTDYTTVSGNTHSVAHYDPAKPTVAFTFNHILSKLSFKVVTDIKKHNETNGVATFKVKEIDINFPQANNVQDVVSFGSDNKPAGVVTYSSTAPAKDDTYDVDAATDIELVYKSAAGFEVPSTVSSSNNTALEPTIAVTADANNVASKTYIVTPVSATGYIKHTFDVKVTYDVEYPNDITETGCIATGTIEYSPEQNQYYIVVIKLNPAQIEFCVEGVEAWDAQTEANNTHEVN